MLYDLIKYLYPNIKDSDFSLQNDGDGDYIKEWCSIEFSKPSNEILESLKLKSEEIINLQKSKRIALKTLNDTDWYYIRKLRTGKEIPEDIQKLSTDAYTILNTKV
jgi:hypothetical protein